MTARKMLKTHTKSMFSLRRSNQVKDIETWRWQWPGQGRNKCRGFSLSTRQIANLEGRPVSNFCYHYKDLAAPLRLGSKVSGHPPRHRLRAGMHEGRARESQAVVSLSLTYRDAPLP